jgi:hypothetical protein
VTPSRRDLLAASVPLALGVAGCSGSDDDATDTNDRAPDADAEDPDTGTTTAAAETSTAAPTATPTPYPELSAAAPTFRDWQPGTGELAGVLAAAHHVGRYRDRRDALPAATYEAGTAWAMHAGYVGVEYDELDGVLVSLSQVGSVLTGSFAKADVESRLEGLPYSRYATADGVSYYEWPAAPAARLVGVASEGVVFGQGDRDATDPGARFVERTGPLFATARGDRERLHETTDRYRRYTDAIGWPLVALAMRPVPADGRMHVGGAARFGEALPDEVANGVSYGLARHATDEAIVERYWLAPDGDASVTTGDLAATLRDPDAQSAIAADGQTVAVREGEGVVDVAVSDPVADTGGGVDPVLVALEARLDGDRVDLVNHGGDALPMARVTVRADGSPVDHGASGSLAAGDSRTVDVPSGTEQVHVVYQPPAAEARTILATAEAA